MIAQVRQIWLEGNKQSRLPFRANRTKDLCAVVDETDPGHAKSLKNRERDGSGWKCSDNASNVFGLFMTPNRQRSRGWCSFELWGGKKTTRTRFVAPNNHRGAIEQKHRTHEWLDASQALGRPIIKESGRSGKKRNHSELVFFS
jgi:hypothetical protein